jgi:cytochrome P450
LATKKNQPVSHVAIKKTFIFYSTDTVPYIREQLKKYGSPLRIWLGPKLFIVLDHPDDAQIIMHSSNSSYKGDVYKFFDFYKNGSGGLLTFNGEIYKSHRRLLDPCFIPKILNGYLPVFNAQSRVMVENVGKMAEENKLFNIEKNIHCCSLDMLCGEYKLI